MVFTRYYVAVGALGWQHLFKLRTFLIVWSRKLLFMLFMFFLLLSIILLYLPFFLSVAFLLHLVFHFQLILRFCMDTFLVFHHKCEFCTNRKLQLMIALNEEHFCHSYSPRGATHQFHAIVTYTNNWKTKVIRLNPVGFINVNTEFNGNAFDDGEDLSLEWTTDSSQTLATVLAYHVCLFSLAGSTFLSWLMSVLVWDKMWLSLQNI